MTNKTLELTVTNKIAHIQFTRPDEFNLDMPEIYSQILNTMTEGAYLIRASDGIILYTNPSFESLFGYEYGEMIGQHVSIVNAPTDIDPLETVKIIGEKIIKSGSWHGEVNNIKKDGTSFWCSASVTTFNHPVHGDIWVTVHTDITKQKLSDEKLKLASQVSRKSWLILP